MTDTPSTEPEGHSKWTLFCPVCDHSSPIPGDWTIRDESDREVYECPDCAAIVTIRPRYGLVTC